jgi:hypothetical protein
MWVVIIYACLVTKVCGFIDSPPVYAEADCQAMLEMSKRALEADDSVTIYDAKCIRVKMSEAAGSMKHDYDSRKWLDFLKPLGR